MQPAKFGPKDFDTTDPKVLIIGFNRCGTTSLHRMFLESGVPAIHFLDDYEKNIAKRVMTNIGLGLAPLHGYDDLRVFSDMTCVDNWGVIECAHLYRDFHRAYPDAYFILNTRPVEGWIASRLQHAKGSYLARSMKASGLDQVALVQQWRAMFARHAQEVSQYFVGNSRFLQFDITIDDPQIIADHVAPDFMINISKWAHRNKQPAVINS